VHVTLRNSGPARWSAATSVRLTYTLPSARLNGSETHAPLSMAEVTLTFAVGPDDVLPETLAGLPEVSVTRRLFRSGESEYQINKTTTRLLDVTELFLGTGVGTRAYSIIEQGRVGQIVSSRPEDRRSILEEADDIIESYDESVMTKSRRQREQWGQHVSRQLKLCLPTFQGSQVLSFVSAPYQEFLDLSGVGASFFCPLQGLAMHRDRAQQQPQHHSVE